MFFKIYLIYRNLLFCCQFLFKMSDNVLICSFYNDVLVVRAVKDIAAGEEIFNCYGQQLCFSSNLIFWFMF